MIWPLGHLASRGERANLQARGILAGTGQDRPRAVPRDAGMRHRGSWSPAGLPVMTGRTPHQCVTSAALRQPSDSNRNEQTGIFRRGRSYRSPPDVSAVPHVSPPRLPCYRAVRGAGAVTRRALLSPRSPPARMHPGGPGGRPGRQELEAGKEPDLVGVAARLNVTGGASGTGLAPASLDFHGRQPPVTNWPARPASWSGRPVSDISPPPGDIPTLQIISRRAA
jgi:hypothetical protein